MPLAQAEAMARAMRAAGRDVELVVYPGEGHGFRQAGSIVDALTRELAFYRRVLGLGEATGPGRDVDDEAAVAGAAGGTAGGAEADPS